MNWNTSCVSSYEKTSDGEWRFKNQTTACVVSLELETRNQYEDTIQTIYMDYEQLEKLMILLDELKSEFMITEKDFNSFGFRFITRDEPPTSGDVYGKDKFLIRYSQDSKIISRLPTLADEYNTGGYKFDPTGWFDNMKIETVDELKFLLKISQILT